MRLRIVVAERVEGLLLLEVIVVQYRGEALEQGLRPLTGNFGGDSTARVASDKCGATQGSLESFIPTEQRCFKDSMDRLT